MKTANYSPRKKLTNKHRKDIAHAYWNTSESLSETAERYGILPSNVAVIGDKFPKIRKHPQVVPPEEKDYAVIKIESKWVEGIKQLLESRRIPYEVPGDFELIEKIESKINEL